MTQQELDNFRRGAKARGFKDAEIESYLRAKLSSVNHEQSTTVKERMGPDRVGNILSGIFGGKQIGEAIGTKIAQGRFGNRIQKWVVGRDLTPEEEATIGGMPTKKQILGDVAGAALTIGTVAGKPAMLAGRAALGQAGKTAGRKILESGARNAALGGAFGAADALKDDKDIGGTLKGVLTGGAVLGGLGAAGTATKLGTQKAAQVAQGAAPGIFRSGLGFSKNTIKAEERAGKSAAEVLMQEGGGTANQLKVKYQTGLEKTEEQLQKILGPSKKRFKSQQIINRVTSKLRREYRNTLTADEIQAMVDKLPMAKLKSSKVVSVNEVNEIKREINRKFLTDNKWLQENPTQTVGAIQTLYDELANAVKAAEKATIPIFQKQSAYIRGIKGLINQSSTTHGPLNTAARIGAPVGAGIVGTVMGGPLAGVATAAASEAMRTTAFRTHLAMSLKKAGLATENLSESEMIKLGELLAKLGLIKGLDQLND